MQNTFFLPRFAIDGSSYSIHQLALTDQEISENEPGLLVSLQDNALLVACRDDIVEIREVEDCQSNLLAVSELAFKHNLVPGQSKLSS
jgi:methionyl-tRNA formyltransferase